MNDFAAGRRLTGMRVGVVPGDGRSGLLPRRVRVRWPARATTALGVLVVVACQHVPPAPIDPAANGERLMQRALGAPEVSTALVDFGQSVPEDGRWSLDQLTIAAWSLRTDIAAARAELAAAGTATRLAGRRPSPGISTSFEHVTNAAAGEKPWVLGASVGFVIETADKRDIRVQQSLAQEDAMQWQLAQLLWRARTELSDAVVEQTLAQQTLALDEEELGLRRAYLDWIETRFSFGAATTQDRLVASEALIALESQRELDRAALAAATARIAGAIGVAPDALAGITPLYPTTEDLPDFDTQDLAVAREAALSNRLDIRRALAEYELAEQDLRAAVASQYPDIVLGPGYLIDQADRKITLSLDLPAFLSNRSEAAIENAIAARAVAASRFDDVQGAALAQINTSFATYAATRAALASARNAEQETARSLRTVRQRLEAGAADRGELVGAEIGLAVRKRNTLETLRTLTQAMAALQDSIQRPLYPPSSLVVTTQTETTP